MISLKDETIIKAPPEKIYYFLTHIDELYMVWHPKDHVFCKVLYGSLDKKGSVVHVFEWVGKFPAYGIGQVAKAEKNSYLEYIPVFPFSLLNFGIASFRIEKISETESRLIAYNECGYNTPIIGPALDFLIRKIFSIDLLKKHMKEEGENMKKYLEGN